MHTRATPAFFHSRAWAVRPARAAAALGAAVLCGCGSTSITGLDGTSEYACQAPEGVKCQSVSGTYYNALANNLPAQRRPAGATTAPAAAPPAPPAPAAPAGTRAAPRTSGAASVVATPSAMPLRSAPRVLRLWIKPWEDADRDLVGDGVVYVQVDSGRWLLEHVHSAQREAIAPVRPAAAAAPGAGSVAAPGGALGRIPPAVNDPAALDQALRALQGQGRTPAPTR